MTTCRKIGFHGHWYTLFLVAFSLFAICACSDSSDSGPIASAGSGQTGVINGAVSGTTVVAVQGNQVIATDDTHGRTPDLDTDGDGEADSYSFTLTGIPTDAQIQVYLIENGGVFPLYFDSDGDGEADTNVIVLSQGSTIELGMVSIGDSIAAGKAICENNPLEEVFVASRTAITELPAALANPVTTGMTLGQLNEKGLNALADGWMLGAEAYFAAAVEKADGLTGNDADTARYFAAFTLGSSFAYELESTQSADESFQSLGDILDAFGYEFEDGIRSNFESVSAPNTWEIPEDAPNGTDIQQFFIDVVLPDAVVAVSYLDQVSTTFLQTWNRPVTKEEVTSDYADVLLLRALYQSIIASIYSSTAYNMDVDLGQALRGEITTQDILASDFLNLTVTPGAGSPELSYAKVNMDGALADMAAAMDFMNARTDEDSVNYNLSLADEESDSVDAATEALDMARDSLTAPVDFSDEVSLNLGLFFTGMDIKSLLPPFDGNEIAGDFPDSDFGGLFVGLPPIGIDVDENEDGVPDVLEGAVDSLTESLFDLPQEVLSQLGTMTTAFMPPDMLEDIVGDNLLPGFDFDDIDELSDLLDGIV